MGKKEFLLQNIKEFFKEAQSASKNKSYNSSVTLYFKVLSVVSDYHILVNDGFIPKNHTERFQLLKAKYREVYDILNKDFPIYQQSDRIKLGSEYS